MTDNSLYQRLNGAKLQKKIIKTRIINKKNVQYFILVMRRTFCIGKMLLLGYAFMFLIKILLTWCKNGEYLCGLAESV